ncbi:MAG TPA: hypothetical protein VND98_10970 [Solirubrobacterales bacterium]|nr:hypothetical protein [Solirubrobacterales bacterium]
MNAIGRTPVVPLAAGHGPDNPPCPACGEPLFGMMAARYGLRGPVSRCESCGLGVVGEAASAEEALRELDRLESDGTLRIINRVSFAAALGAAGWAGLQPSARYLFTVESVRRLVAERDQIISRRRWVPAHSLALTWQTLLNSLTFGHNGAFGALGWGEASPAEQPWQRRIDALVSVGLAIPALVPALVIELSGAPIGRGSAISLRLEVL